MNNVVNLLALKIVKPQSQLAKNISAAITARGYTSVLDFERACGIKHQRLYRLLTGYTQTLHADILNTIADKLQVPASVLLNGTEQSIELLHIFRQTHKPGWYRIRNDEMAPTFQVNDFAMIDYAVTKFDNSGIYAIGSEDNFALRRLSMNPLRNTVIVSVDNKNYNYTEEVELQTINIIGFVMGRYSSFADFPL